MFLAEIVRPEQEPMKRIQHTLTTAQLLNLATAPVILLPSPGPNKFYAIHHGWSFYKFNTTPYTLSGTANLLLSGINTSNVYVPLLGYINTSVDRAREVFHGCPTILASELYNQPLALRLFPGALLTLGNGTLKVVIFYTIEDQI